MKNNGSQGILVEMPKKLPEKKERNLMARILERFDNRDWYESPWGLVRLGDQ